METVIQNAWAKSKILIKGLIVALLALLLQIPMIYVKDLIAEREARQKEAIAEVSSKWAGGQNIVGPIIVLPHWESSDTTRKQTRTRSYAHFLPDQLTINATVTPQEKHRGIYKVMLYSSQINLKGSFKELQFNQLGISPENIIWNEAFVKFQISDAKGLNDELKLNWNDSIHTLSPLGEGGAGNDGLSAPLNIAGAKDLNNIDFSADFSMNGSGQLMFTPIGKSTTVNLNSKWPHPSFNGNILPQATQVNDSGFTASWKSLSHKRNFPQQWHDNSYLTHPTPANNNITSNNLSSAAFGADLFVPVNGYQKTMRSVKYALLCILLTYASFFLIETTNKKSVHPFQYGLIGLALVLFYTLLLSFSEYIGFNWSYVIASVATIGLIAWFAKGLLSSTRLSTILAAILLLMYTYVFTILQLQDYSLLLGSVGLFITLAVIMHFSKKIQW